MLFAMLQEQHDKQIAAMTARNKANMDAMMDRMNSLVAGRGGDRHTPIQKTDRENTSPGGNTCPPTNSDQKKKPRKQKALCPHCKTFVLEANKDKCWPGWKAVNATARQELGTETVDVELAANLLTTKLNSNYWSPLACLVKEQEEPITEYHTSIERAMSAIRTGNPPNKVAAHWAQKLHNRKSRRFAFLDTGATTGAAPAED
jgi:hypothetical protein